MSAGDSGEGRGRPREFGDQDILKVFDYSDEPMLTTSEVANGLREHFEIDVTAEAVRQRLSALEEREKVARKDFGARAVGWRALVALALSADAADSVDASREEIDQGEHVALEDV